MEITRAELPSTEVIIHSQDWPDRAGGLTYEKIGLAFMRLEKQASGLKFTLLRKDPLIVLMPRDHALAARVRFGRGTSRARHLSECPRSGHRPRGLLSTITSSPLA